MRKIVLLLCLFTAAALSAPAEGCGVSAKQADGLTHKHDDDKGQAGDGGLTAGLPQGHPRYLTDADGKEPTWKLINEEPWAAEVFDGLRKRTDTYVDRGADWLSSRLQMYWNTHATEVYVKGEYYDHAGGEAAPYPTVMYTGARSNATSYVRPKLEEVEPYVEDQRGVYLANSVLEGHPHEWASLSKTGNIIQSLNQEIAERARDAAFLWWMTGEEKYAVAAAAVFDTYMTGIYYRNVPIDLNHGHQQTLVGMSSFEVIHENILDALVPLYDFLYDYLQAHYADKMDIYAGAFKKWADNIIDNGVPHNNWNIIQAHFILNIGLILEDDDRYADGKGRGYYTDYVLNRSSIRQWSLSRLAGYGFDNDTGIWAECPGYSVNVVTDYADFTALFDRLFRFDLTEKIPVIPQAVAATPQYLFPSGKLAGFGDTHPDKLRTDIFERMIANAQLYGKREQERRFTAMLKLFNPDYGATATESKRMPVAVTSFFTSKPLVIDGTIPAGKIDDYVTPTFYAPNVSWLVQRNGMDARHSLMASLNASEGNHAHANGISMELYGKGYTLAPDAGIGLTLYSGQDYLEYYSQFPAHNTVCVDGISSYPVMKSNHAFKVTGCYPEAGKRTAYQPVSYSELLFREPESQADQDRLTSIVTTGDTTGYYVDIFRSHKVEGGDKTHDYFYHNLGQTMQLTAADGSDLELQPTEELAFAGAHLYAYSYIYNKVCATTDKDVKALFTIAMPDRDDISMTMWMKGEEERTVFSALSPMTEGLSRAKDMPYTVKEQPTLTFVARQAGEAWQRPFVAVYEPSTVNEPGTIASVSFPEVTCTEAGSHVGVLVEHKDGRKDLILSSDNAAGLCESGALQAQAAYALYSSKEGEENLLFMGNGTLLQTPEVTVTSAVPVNVLLERKADGWHYTATGRCSVDMQGKTYEITETEGMLP